MTTPFRLIRSTGAPRSKKKKNSRPETPRQQKARLGVEWLEDRAVPATFTVNSLQDVSNALDGLMTLQRLQSTRTRTRIIVLTASEDKQEFVQAVRFGTSGIVLKQTATDLLIKSIRKVHAGEIWLDANTTAAVMRQFSAPEEAPPLPPAPVAQSRDRDRTPLSQREREIVALVAQGFKNKEMAEKLFISEQTVKNHLHNIFDKLGVSDRLELALYAIHRNLHISH